MRAPRRFVKGAVIRVHLAGHPFPVDLVSIQIKDYAAGGGLILVMDRGDGEAERIVALLNAAERDADSVAHECWAAAQLAPGEGIADGAGRISAILRDE